MGVDPKAWANGIMELRADPKRARVMGEKAREKVTREYNLESTLERQMALVQQILADSTPGAF